MGEVHIIGGERKKALWKEKGNGDQEEDQEKGDSKWKEQDKGGGVGGVIDGYGWMNKNGKGKGAKVAEQVRHLEVNVCTEEGKLRCTFSVR